MEREKIDPKGTIYMPAWAVPAFNVSLALERKVEKNLLFKTWGGLGDQICAEPTLRYAFKAFKDCEISLASEHPQLFAHLPFKDVFNLKREKPIWENYLSFDTIVPPNPPYLLWQFMNHCLTNAVDFASICALRAQLPVDEREILLSAPLPNETVQELITIPRTVLVHAGRHWPSKTFPKDWWDAVLFGLKAADVRPILIGADTDDNRGTVDVNTSGCLDFRNKLSILESLWLIQRSRVLITNDSAPLHMAASRNPLDPLSGDIWTGYIATCKHPDYISHWRRPPRWLKLQWNWREENLGLGGIWNSVDHCPNKPQEITIEKVDEELLRTWLPHPSAVVEWTTTRLGL